MSTNRPAIITNALFFGGVLLFLAIAPSFARAQANSPPPAANVAAKVPGYDVAVIKPNKSDSGSVTIDSHNDLYSATNVRLKTLLQNVYDIKENLISGVPEPINSARFDVVAKIVDPDLNALKKLTKKQERSMLLPVLVERFQLKAHTEIKILPVYDLVVNKSGPKFKQLAADNTGGSGTSIHNNELTARNITMASLASTLSDQVHRTVIDKTNLTGKYDLGLKWAPNDGSGAQNDSGPSIFTALREQLGLKLQPAKGPVETLVIDHVEQPSEN